MDTINKVSHLLSYRYSAIPFTLLIGLLLGILSPDFRYGLLSIFLIQVARPVVFAVPMIVGFWTGARSNLRLCVGVGLGGLVLCEIVAITVVMLETSGVAFSDHLSIPIAIGSLAAQFFVFTLAVFILWFRGWHLERRKRL